MSRWTFQSWIGLLLLTVTGVSTICSIHLQSHSEDEYCTGCWNVSHCQHSGSTFTRTIILSLLMKWLLGSNLSQNNMLTLLNMLTLTCVKYKTILTFKRGQKAWIYHTYKKIYILIGHHCERGIKLAHTCILIRCVRDTRTLRCRGTNCTHTFFGQLFWAACTVHIHV